MHGEDVHKISRMTIVSDQLKIFICVDNDVYYCRCIQWTGSAH